MEDTLFDFEDTTSSPPACGLCGQPRRWNRARHDWALYCGGQACHSSTRTCRHCGRTYERPDGRTRYCSADCMFAANVYTRAARRLRDCVSCGTPCRVYAQVALCASCAEPIKAALPTLRNHHAGARWYLQLLSDPTCPGCGRDLLLRLDNRRLWLNVDHDHGCCPGAVSCGVCVRGLLCSGCNSTLGLSGDSAAVLRALAGYIDDHGRCDR